MFWSILSEAVKKHPLCKDSHESMIIDTIGKNLIYAKDRVIGRANRKKKNNDQANEEDEEFNITDVEPLHGDVENTSSTSVQ